MNTYTSFSHVTKTAKSDIEKLRNELKYYVGWYRSCTDPIEKEWIKIDGTQVKRELDLAIGKMIMEPTYRKDY